jgi:hypothetical protein
MNPMDTNKSCSLDQQGSMGFISLLGASFQLFMIPFKLSLQREESSLLGRMACDVTASDCCVSSPVPLTKFKDSLYILVFILWVASLSVSEYVYLKVMNLSSSYYSVIIDLKRKEFDELIKLSIFYVLLVSTASRLFSLHLFTCVYVYW